MRTRRRRWRIWVIALAIVIAVGIGIAWRLSLAAPVWWNPPDVQSEAAQHRADRAEYRLVEEAQRIRPVDEVWRLRIREEDINDWLATRLPKWVAHERDIDWPETVGTVQVNITTADVSLGIEYQNGQRMRVLVIEGVVWVDGDTVVARVEQAAIGRLPVPRSAVEEVAIRLEEAIPEVTVLLRDDPSFVEQDTDELRTDARFALADGRIIELIDLLLEEGAIVVTCRTVAQRELVDDAAMSAGGASDSSTE